MNHGTGTDEGQRSKRVAAAVVEKLGTTPREKRALKRRNKGKGLK